MQLSFTPPTMFYTPKVFDVHAASSQSNQTGPNENSGNEPVIHKAASFRILSAQLAPQIIMVS